MAFGVETIARENLENALACYKEKIPKLYWQLYNNIFASSFNLLSDTQKIAFNAKIETIKTELSKQTLLDHTLKLDETNSLQEKIARLKAKKQAVLDELAKRDIYGEPETVHHTTYYIDYINGLDTNDGLTPETAWKTIAKYTTVTVRSAGDIAYVRRDQTHSYSANIEFDEDGAWNNPIQLVGDDGTGWPGDQNIRPTIDFGANAAYFDTNGDHCWTFKRLIINGSSASYGLFRVGGYFNWFYNVLFKNCTGGAYGVVFIYGGRLVYFKDCAWEGNSNSSIEFFSNGEDAILEDCTFDNNATCIMFAGNNNYVKLLNVVFGGTTANSSWDINIGSSKRMTVIGKNVVFNDANKVNVGTDAFQSRVLIEDYNGTKLDNRAWYGEGEIVRNTTVTRSGGADSSAECVPKANCNPNAPLGLIEIPIWATASQKTYTIYICGSGWSTFPTASELWIEAYYYDGATAKRATLKSTQVLTANDTWTEFSVTVTPNSAAPLYLRGFLAKYQAGAKVYVDIKPVVT